MKRFKIIYEDENIVVINKPAGLLTVEDRYDKSLPDLTGLLHNKYENVMTVHRLDKDTSGVILFAKDAETHRKLNEQFQERKPEKIYHAVVDGIFPENEMDIDIPLMPNPGNKPGMIPSARGKKSLTKVTVLERFKNATLLECKLVTGRHHQLRAHVSAVGHSLLVDPLYGKSKGFYLSSVKRHYNLGRDKEERPIISRITMHSRKLTVYHPGKNEDMTFEAEYPKDFAVLLKQLRKWAPVPEYMQDDDEFFT